MKETKQFRVTLGQCLETLSRLGNLYESIATGEDGDGFRIRADEAAATMRASVIFLVDFCKERRWIPVEERLPSEHAYVLAYHSNAARIIAWRYGNAWQTDAGTGGRGDVTHWMPLPEPPEWENV